MPIKFTVHKKVNPLNKQASDKYYAKAVSNGTFEFEDLVKTLSEKCKLHEVDCLRLLLHMQEIMGEQLSNGKIVRFGELGNFQIGITSTGEITEAKVTQKVVNGAKVNFRAGKKFKKLLEVLTYEKVTPS